MTEPRLLASVITFCNIPTNKFSLIFPRPEILIVLSLLMDAFPSLGPLKDALLGLSKLKSLLTFEGDGDT